jgi:hypothetical protein
MEFSELWKTIQAKIISSPRIQPSVVTIPRDHVDRNHDGSLDFTLRKDQHYFSVVVNEMFLGKARNWFSTIEPLVYVVTEFTYQGKRHAAPFVVGAGLLKERGLPDSVANGTILRNTCACGPHPYRGGGLTLSVVLCAAQTGTALRPALKLIESTAAALGFSPALSPYLKVAGILMDGFETLFETGAVTPLVGFRDSFGPAAGSPLQPGYFALIDSPGVDPRRLWVRNNQLYEGGTLEASAPYRGGDFVLYSIGCPGPLRDDVAELPFNELWKRVLEEAASPVEDPNYKNARQLMVTLYQSIVLSPDLTEPHADALAEEYAARMKKVHAEAVKYGMMAGEERAPSSEQQRAARDRRLSWALLETN